MVDGKRRPMSLSVKKFNATREKSGSSRPVSFSGKIIGSFKMGTADQETLRHSIVMESPSTFISYDSNVKMEPGDGSDSDNEDKKKNKTKNIKDYLNDSSKPVAAGASASSPAQPEGTPPDASFFILDDIEEGDSSSCEESSDDEDNAPAKPKALPKKSLGNVSILSNLSAASALAASPMGRRRLLTPIMRSPRVVDDSVSGRVSVPRMEELVEELEVEEELTLEARRRESFLKEERIAEGTTACVYKALDKSSQKTVALKVFDKAQHPLMARRVRLEAEIQDQVARKSDYISNVIGCIDREQSITIVFDYLTHGDLFDVLVTANEGQGLTGLQVIEYAYQMSEAVATLHDNNIVHRDLKLENVCLSKDNTLQLIDFGEAAFVGNPVVGFVGTITYMSPEVFCLKKHLNAHRKYLFDYVQSGKADEDIQKKKEGKPLSTEFNDMGILQRCVVEESSKASDIWSLGIIFFALAYGQFPWYKADLEDELYARHVKQTDTPLQVLSDEWKELINRMLAIDIEDRWTIHQVRDYLQELRSSV